MVMFTSQLYYPYYKDCKELNPSDGAIIYNIHRNRPPPHTDHSPISITLFRSQAIANTDILTP